MNGLLTLRELVAQLDCAIHGGVLNVGIQDLLKIAHRELEKGLRDDE